MAKNFEAESETVGISPGVGILSVFRHIKYKPWFAIAEYVDNAIDSYLKNKDALDSTFPGYQLIINIELNQEEKYIKISDNAAGITGDNLERALRMAVRPLDRSGLSEFGMGMKAASCWFSPRWSVETQALGDTVKRKVVFDVQRIVDEETTVLGTNPSPSVLGHHFTNIHLANVYSMPNPHAISKIREHLTSIYRDFIREDRFFDRVAITVNGKQLKYKAPSVLIAPLFSDKSGQHVEWRKSLDFVCAGGQRVKGFAAIYPTAKTKEAGFALLRRGRVVEGSYDEPYRPAKIFGAPGSFYSQRIYGELHLDDFTASFTKDSVQWEDAEEDFLSCLRAAMKSPGLDLLKQANGIRMKELPSAPEVDNSGEKDRNTGRPNNEAKGSASKSTTGKDNLAQPGAAPLPDPRGEVKHDSQSTNARNSEDLNKVSDVEKVNTPKLPERRLLSAVVDGVRWIVFIELSYNPAHTEWMSINRLCIPVDAQAGVNERHVGVRISIIHPFTSSYCANEAGQIEALLRLSSAMAIAQTITQEVGAPHSSLFMSYVNELLMKLQNKH